jgi:phosphate-selective porin OprO/OprP
LGDEVFDRDLADPNKWTNEVSMTDIGVNWYLNRYTKFYFDWQHASYSSPVLVNEETGKFSTDNDLFWIRCQFYF